MKLFLAKVVFFLILLCPFFIFPLTVVYLGKEYVSMKEIINAQKGSKVLFGFAYNGESFIPYKKLLVQTVNPVVITLGTSRVMQIRKELFIYPNDFVNAGGAGKTLGQAKSFIEELDNESNIKLIILELNQEMFYGDTTTIESRIEPSVIGRVFDILSLMSRRIYLDYFAHKYTIGGLVESYKKTNNIGISALINGDGFREDGSYKYNQAQHNENLKDVVASQVKEKIKKIKEVNPDSTLYSNKAVGNNIKILEEILKLCKERGITIIGISPPYPKDVYDAMSSTNGFYYDININLPKEIDSVFRTQGFSFFDLSSIDTFGGKESEFVDAVHGTDVMYLRMMIYMTARDKNLNKYVNINQLNGILRSTEGAFLKF